jgi:molybdate transport system substrate-binding protein
VASGEADAGLVYVTDAATTADVQTVATPGADAVVNTYPIVALDNAANPRPRGRSWTSCSDAARATLTDLGFGRP